MGRRGRHKSISGKEWAERRFPHRVDIPVPDDGLGRRLDTMLAWCRENMEAGEWAQHGHTEYQPPELPTHVARFYFMEAKVADTFRQSWCCAAPGVL